MQLSQDDCLSNTSSNSKHRHHHHKSHAKQLPLKDSEKCQENEQVSLTSSMHRIIYPHSRPIKRRRRLSVEETRYLQEAFVQNPRPNSENRNIIANKLGLSTRAIQIWFQNRRAKHKKDSTYDDSVAAAKLVFSKTSRNCASYAKEGIFHAYQPPIVAENAKETGEIQYIKSADRFNGLKETEDSYKNHQLMQFNEQTSSCPVFSSEYEQKSAWIWPSLDEFTALLDKNAPSPEHYVLLTPESQDSCWTGRSPLVPINEEEQLLIEDILQFQKEPSVDESQICPMEIDNFLLTGCFCDSASAVKPKLIESYCLESVFSFS